jgi:hypothetical protein
MAIEHSGGLVGRKQGTRKNHQHQATQDPNVQSPHHCAHFRPSNMISRDGTSERPFASIPFFPFWGYFRATLRFGVSMSLFVQNPNRFTEVHKHGSGSIQSQFGADERLIFVVRQRSQTLAQTGPTLHAGTRTTALEDLLTGVVPLSWIGCTPPSGVVLFASIWIRWCTLGSCSRLY